MATYLITGGAGFIGSNLVHTLVEQGDDVRVLDNLSSGRMENLEGVLDKIQFVEGDIRNMDQLRSLAEGADYILHQAAVPSVVRSVEDPLTSNDTNINGTLNVFLAARDMGVKRVVAASSSSVYGDTEVLPKVESMVAMPISPYAVTKYVAELYGSVFTETFGTEIVCLRYFNVFGPRQDPDSEYSAVIPKFITLMDGGTTPTIFGDGSQTRDFCFVDNVVQANLLSCTAPGAGGKAFNVGCGARISLLDLIDGINRILGLELTPNFEDWRAGDVRDSLADISAAIDVLGYAPTIRVDEGLEKTVAWYTR